MTIRKFDPGALESEPHRVRFKDIYPWDAIERTPFGSSLAVIEPGGATILHGHAVAETFVICRGSGTISIDDVKNSVGPGDVVYLRPNSVHQLANDSDSEELMFVSVHWTPQVARPKPRPAFVVPSPPTSNGPLHLGHLGGPYLIADVAHRFARMQGVPSSFVFLADEHQSYVMKRAEVEGGAVEKTALAHSQQFVEVLRKFHAEPDAFVFPSRDAEYQRAVRGNFERLRAAGALELRSTEDLYCDRCERVLYDGLVEGTCPSCSAPSNGFACQICCAPNETNDLVRPICTRCKRTPSKRRAQRWFFPLAPFVERLHAYQAQLALSPKLRGLAARILERPGLAPPASEISSWGIPLELAGFEGQVIAPWFEIALAAPYLRDRFAPKSEVIACFGRDNAYLYLIHDPAVCMALGVEEALPARLATNEFLLLEDRKMSTSGGHALDAREALEQIPAEPLRLFLAMTRPEEAPESVSLEQARGFAASLDRHWRSWLEGTARALAEESDSKVPSAEAWSPEQSHFLAELELHLERAGRGYRELSLREASSAILELAGRAHAFSVSQEHLANLAALRSHRMTGLAVELAAVKSLAVMIAPLMPTFAARIWDALGESGSIVWPNQLELLPAGRALALDALASRPLFAER
jgi:methionyl-tRNA synthetase